MDGSLVVSQTGCKYSYEMATETWKKTSRKTTEDLACNICRRSTRHGSDVDRSKKSRKRSSEIEESRCPMSQQELGELSLSKSFLGHI